MKIFVPLALLSCLCTFSSASEAQTQATKNQLLPYTDDDGYQVLSFIIDSRTEKLKNGPVWILHQTISGDTFGQIRAECSNRFPGEFQSALEDFDKRTKTRLLLQQRFSIRKEYKFVESPVGTQSGTYSVSAVGFDENKARAIVLVQYLVGPPGSLIVGGDKSFYLLRKTETGWQRIGYVSKCGQIY